MSRNLIFVSHCDFNGNSALHLFSIANVLTDLGHSCAVCVPGRPETVLDHGEPRFQVLDYDEALRYGVSFANGKAPDLVHAWTPRELVRKTTMSLARRYSIPYFIHLEDNESVVLLDELPGWSLEELERLPIRALDLMVANHRTHPYRSRRLLAGAAGITALIDRLLEFKPPHVPGMVFFPGHDAEFAKIDGRDEELRAALGILPDELLAVYTGSVHYSNFQEIRSLLLAVALVNRLGIRVKLAKTGSDPYVLPELSDPEIAQHVIDRGYVVRSDLHRLLAAADLLVQPGQSNEFNDYRFPSKLPEFLASGRPVILPRSNIGLLLKDAEEALVLEQGDSADIAAALQRLAADPKLRTRIGRNGRAFALHNLDWAKNISALPSFYDRCLAEARPEAQACSAEEPAVPKLIVFNDLRLPEAIAAQAALARRFGVYGFCFYYRRLDGRRLLERPLDQYLAGDQPDFPFCICCANENWTRRPDAEEDEVLGEQEYSEDSSVNFIRDVIPILKDPRYIRVRRGPVLMVYGVTLLPDPRATTETWRAECRKAGIPSVHLVAMQSLSIGDPRPFGFDAAVEFPPQTGRFLVDPLASSGANPASEGHLEGYWEVLIDQLAKPLPDYPLYRGAISSGDDPRSSKQRKELHSSPGSYQTWLRRATAQTMALEEAQEPLIFVNAWSEWVERAILEPGVHNGYLFLEATRAGLSQGLADYLRARGVRIEEAAVSNLAIPEEEDAVGSELLQNQARRPHKTDVWFTDGHLASIAATYRDHFRTAPLSYATARDFCDSHDYLHPIATASGDLKDSQRPWMLKAILSVVPPRSRVLEIGPGEPFIADILDRLGYEVWAADPYDGSGAGSLEYERFRNEYPSVRFVRGRFGDQLLPAPPGGFDCIYSISVLQHVPGKLLEGVFAGMKKYLRPRGWSIHAFDHVHKGSDGVDHFEKLKSIVRWSGFEEIELTQLIGRIDADPETHYFSAESHNCSRGSLSYDEIRTRVSVSIQMVTRAVHLRVPTAEMEGPNQS